MREQARSRGNVAAWLLWGVVLAALLARAGMHPGRATSLTTYLTGGMAWRDSGALYMNWRGFVYPPVIAEFFGLFTRLPRGAAEVLWRGITAAIFLSGLGAILPVFEGIPAGRRGMVFLGVLPLSIGNLDNAQANPLIAGLMMLAVAACQWERWTLCAAAAGIATAFKIYPVALAMLLCVLRPRELWWRLAIVLIVLGVLPLAGGDAHYVMGQYHAWVETRLRDDRFTYPMKDAPLDLWYLTVRLHVLPVSERVYMTMQMLAGAGVAWLVWMRKRTGAGSKEVLGVLYLLASIWMLLLGPATENQTYVVLAPAACLMAVEALGRRGAGKWMAFAAYSLMLAAVARNSLTPHLKSPWEMAIQPIGALVLLGAVLISRDVFPIRERPR